MTIYWITLFIGLANANAAEKGQIGNIAFNRIGDTSFHVEYTRIRVNLDIPSSRRACTILSNKLEETLDNHRNKGTHAIAKFSLTRALRVQNRFDRLVFMTDPLPDRGGIFGMDKLETKPELPKGQIRQKRHVQQPGVPRREKRFAITLGIGIAALIVGASATAIGIEYGAHSSLKTDQSAEDLMGLEAKLNTINDIQIAADHAISDNIEQSWKVHQLTMVAVNEIADNTNLMSTNNLVDHTLNRLEAEATRVETIMAAAIQNQAHPAMLEHRNISEWHRKTLAIADSRGLVPLVRYGLDYLQFDTTYIAEGKAGPDRDLFVHINVPLTSTKSIMTIMRYTQLPVAVSGGFEITIESNHEFIAISDDNTLFRPLTLSDFLRCKRLGRTFLCDKGNVVRKWNDKMAIITQDTTRDSGLCLINLLREKYEAARFHCDITFTKASPQIRQLSATKFAAFSIAPQQALVTCNGEGSPNRQSVRPGTMINIETGCEAVTDDWIIASQGSVTSSSVEDYVHYRYAEELSRLTAGIDIGKINNLHKTPGNSISNATRFTMNQALAALEEVPRNVIHPHTAATAIGGTTISFIIIIIITATACLFRKQLKSLFDNIGNTDENLRRAINNVDNEVNRAIPEMAATTQRLDQLNQSLRDATLQIIEQEQEHLALATRLDTTNTQLQQLQLQVQAPHQNHNHNPGYAIPQLMTPASAGGMHAVTGPQAAYTAPRFIDVSINPHHNPRNHHE